MAKNDGELLKLVGKRQLLARLIPIVNFGSDRKLALLAERGDARIPD
jgi:hypothetical protein